MHLHLRPGTKLVCRVEGESIVLTPEHSPIERPKLVRDSITGLMVSKSASSVKITSDDVRAALLDFP